MKLSLSLPFPDIPQRMQGKTLGLGMDNSTSVIRSEMLRDQRCNRDVK